MSESIKTLCPYCGVGCGLEVTPPAQANKPTNRDAQGNPLWKVQGDRSHPSSQGMVCVKGATIAESLGKDRLLHPMVRDSLDQPFQRVSWDEAFDRIVNRIQKIRSKRGADAICFYGSGQLQTEDYYTAQKLLKGCLGTNNFDANSRLCMSSAVAAYIQSFGYDGPPCCYDDLELTDCAFLIGTNTAECHPIIFNRLRKHHKKNKNVKLIVVDPRRTTTAEAADLHLAIHPGTDIDLMNGIAHLLMRWGYIDTAFIDECTSGFPDYAEVIRHYPPELVARKCGIRMDDLETAARYWGESGRVLSLWSMGVNQSSEGTAKARTIINLHLMTAQIGKPGAGPFSLTGQPNAMGGREAGGLSLLLPGYRFVTNPQHRQEVEQFWNLPPGQIAPKPGRSAWDIITGLEDREVEFLWVVATNPLVSMPDLERTKAAMSRSPFTVYSEAYYPTETAAYAHVLLPAAQWSEKSGTMTNSERVVTLCPAFRTPPGEAKADWEVFAEVGRRLGFPQQFAFKNAAEVYAEYAQLTRNRPCDQTGISHERLKTEGPMQWPCREAGGMGLPALHRSPVASSKRLYTDLRFHTPDGRARFGAYHSKGLAEPPDPDYPFVLTNGRLYGHWHTLTRTGRIEKTAAMHPNPFIEIHPRDAQKLGIQENDWVEVQSRRGKARFPAKITKAITAGTLFVPMHWGFLWADDAEANALTHPALCPESKQPELKACAVQLVPVGTQVKAAGVGVEVQPGVLSPVASL
ncbi:molybdopterin oxidoreductase family protein [Microcoleus sp. FACHB-672]|uniref:molybdopterin oxidoreductase family protein n=1 Tax=Microcoleus sp. FACHB-672 TaxID=2692825 RepID=UPI001684A320|nr:nitrate reductase [Microcoleus sp. FACHB-672]MBD2043431.1 molybdopterin-dependent oxidoreductase [Microcoleus sp. FACHB-672]